MGEAQADLKDHVRPEMLQSMVETGTRICSNILEAEAEIRRLRSGLLELARQQSLQLACAGTHPFSSWEEQEVTDQERYLKLAHHMQDVARNIVVFALHVHVSMPDPERRLQVMNSARYYLPRLLALSTSSPFWRGRETGLKSYRSVVWSRMPRTGIPPAFQSTREFDRFVRLLVESRTLDEGTKIWWDVRPHVVHPTLEFRVCDAPTKLRETLCIAALTQALCARLLEEPRPEPEPAYMPLLIHENKFRVMRHGLDARLYDFQHGGEAPVRDLLLRLVEYVDPVVDELGSRQEVAYVETILAEGTSADRQLETFRATGRLDAVVARLVEETRDQGEADALTG